MNKKLISAAVLVGLAGSASAVNVNPDGLGQVLLYPYYTTNGGKFTNVQVVNTTGQAKAVKVRFSEGVNTWEVLDFNLYLSPYDVWTGVVSQDANGVPTLNSTDTSCTAPAIPAGGVALRDYNITAYAGKSGEVTNLTPAERLTEGHLEVIEMGNIADADLVAAVTHANGVPADCNAVRAAWTTGPWATDSTFGMSAPTGGLFGMAEIIDVAEGTDRGYDATAIDGFFDVTKGVNGIAHSTPGNSFPNLNGDMLRGSTVASALNVGSTTSNVYNNGAPLTSTWTTTMDALSASLSVASLSNVYYIGDDLAAATDWVVSFPTKHFYVNPNTATATSGQVGIAPAVGDTWAYKAPFSNGFGVTVAMTSFDREETTSVPQLDFSPSITSTNELVNEVNVLQLSGARNVFASKLANTTAMAYDGGWAQLDFRTGSMTSNEGHVYKGLPALGFASTKVVNGDLNGTLANYAVLYNHKYTRSISN